jgi:cysteinyl-tRNA synthetase
MDEPANNLKTIKYRLAFNFRLLCPNGENNPPEYQFEEIRAMQYYKIYEARDKAERENQIELEKKNREIEELKRRLEESERATKEAQRQSTAASSSSSSRTRSSAAFCNTVNDDFTNVSAFTVGFTTLKSKHDDTEVDNETTNVSKFAKYDFDSTKVINYLTIAS